MPAFYESKRVIEMTVDDILEVIEERREWYKKRNQYHMFTRDQDVQDLYTYADFLAGKLVYNSGM